MISTVEPATDTSESDSSLASLRATELRVTRPDGPARGEVASSCPTSSRITWVSNPSFWPCSILSRDTLTTSALGEMTKRSTLSSCGCTPCSVLLPATSGNTSPGGSRAGSLPSLDAAVPAPSDPGLLPLEELLDDRDEVLLSLDVEEFAGLLSFLAGEPTGEGAFRRSGLPGPSSACPTGLRSPGGSGFAGSFSGIGLLLLLGSPICVKGISSGAGKPSAPFTVASFSLTISSSGGLTATFWQTLSPTWEEPLSWSSAPVFLAPESSLTNPGELSLELCLHSPTTMLPEYIMS